MFNVKQERDMVWFCANGEKYYYTPNGSTINGCVNNKDVKIISYLGESGEKISIVLFKEHINIMFSSEFQVKFYTL